MFEIPQQVIHETVGGETMIVRLDSGNYYSLNSTGGRVWALIEKGASGSQIAAEFAGLYGLDKKIAEAQTDLFLSSLIKEGLIFQNGSSPDAGAAHKPDGIRRLTGSFEPPLLNKYSDMQELLILDPIHDVSEAGWPNPKSDNGDGG
jgi:hypothetical protein